MKFLLISLFVFISAFTYCQVEEQYYPHYIPTNKFDTQKVRILYDSSINLNGWIIKQWNEYYAGIDPGACIGCSYPSPDWLTTNILLYSDKKRLVDMRKVWQYKEWKWKTGL